ncbi:hypothetical protein KPC_0122 [Acinetobacter stercoris]|uniref:Uncharacterized protein n=1 Tax=Acinetobacter stercoris TaxID=2126983 RepID=A0A2U3MU68_9GAMM|nr:hypothetical protein KPC_0122 [Acinetobacter stercoris]
MNDSQDTSLNLLKYNEVESPNLFYHLKIKVMSKHHFRLYIKLSNQLDYPFVLTNVYDH